jgi:hypothetical protein
MGLRTEEGEDMIVHYTRVDSTPASETLINIARVNDVTYELLPEAEIDAMIGKQGDVSQYDWRTNQPVPKVGKMGFYDALFAYCNEHLKENADIIIGDYDEPKAVFFFHKGDRASSFDDCCEWDYRKIYGAVYAREQRHKMDA